MIGFLDELEPHADVVFFCLRLAIVAYGVYMVRRIARLVIQWLSIEYVMRGRIEELERRGKR